MHEEGTPKPGFVYLTLLVWLVVAQPISGAHVWVVQMEGALPSLSLIMWLFTHIVSLNVKTPWICRVGIVVRSHARVAEAYEALLAR